MWTTWEMAQTMPDWMWAVTIIGMAGTIAYILIHNWRNR
jgi:hypothetical protein